MLECVPLSLVSSETIETALILKGFSARPSETFAKHSETRETQGDNASDSGTRRV